MSSTGRCSVEENHVILTGISNDAAGCHHRFWRDFSTWEDAVDTPLQFVSDQLVSVLNASYTTRVSDLSWAKRRFIGLKLQDFLGGELSHDLMRPAGRAVRHNNPDLIARF